MKNTFLDKLLNRIDRVGQGDLQAYLQRLNNEKGFFETIFNTLQEGIVVVDAKGRRRGIDTSDAVIRDIPNQFAIIMVDEERGEGLDVGSL